MSDPNPEDTGPPPVESAGGPDLRATLHADHVEVTGLLRDLLATSTDEVAQREALRDAVVRQGLVHARAEEEVVYDFLARHSLRDELHHAFREHDELARLVALLERMDGGDPKLDLIAEQLADMLQHHVHEEETHLLLLAEAEIGRSRLAELIPAFEACKIAMLAELEEEASSRDVLDPRFVGRRHELEESDSRF